MALQPEIAKRPSKDTTPAVPADAIRYRVMETTFVNGRIEHPRLADGTQNYVMAAPGLEGKALQPDPVTAKKTKE